MGKISSIVAEFKNQHKVSVKVSPEGVRSYFLHGEDVKAIGQKLAASHVIMTGLSFEVQDHTPAGYDTDTYYYERAVLDHALHPSQREEIRHHSVLPYNFH